MAGFYRETFFGRTVNSLSGGRLFKQQEALEPSLLSQYMPTASTESSSANLPASNASSIAEGEKKDPEKGKDYTLVDWLPNDPEVRAPSTLTAPDIIATPR